MGPSNKSSIFNFLFSQSEMILYISDKAFKYKSIFDCQWWSFFCQLWRTWNVGDGCFFQPFYLAFDHLWKGGDVFFFRIDIDFVGWYINVCQYYSSYELIFEWAVYRFGSTYFECSFWKLAKNPHAGSITNCKF